MKKSDQSVHKICIAAIKRHTMTPYDFQMTTFYVEAALANLSAFQDVILEENELPICSTYVATTQWSLLTTRRMISKEDIFLHEHKIENFKAKFSGNFKGIGGKKVEIGKIELLNGHHFPYYIETGKASMMMIYGIQTAMQITPKSQDEIEILERRYRKKGFIED